MHDHARVPLHNPGRSGPGEHPQLHLRELQPVVAEPALLGGCPAQFRHEDPYVPGRDRVEPMGLR